MKVQPFGLRTTGRKVSAYVMWACEGIRRDCNQATAGPQELAYVVEKGLHSGRRNVLDDVAEEDDVEILSPTDADQFGNRRSAHVFS